MLTKERIAEIRNDLREKTVGIIGDFCLDIYWRADMTRSELSRETPHFPLPVIDEAVSLGAGGNVAANLAALCPKKVVGLSLYGDDWRGMLLLEQAARAGIASDLFIRTQGRFTNAYCKPMKKGVSDVVYEDPRLDFDNYAPIDRATEDAVIANLDRLAELCDVLCVADQFRYGIVTDRVRERIISHAKNGLPVIADSRYHIAKFTDCILKPNEAECWRAVYGDEGYLTASSDELTATADTLARRNRATVFCTLGDKGSYLTKGENGCRTPAVKVAGPLDICGAGDTTLAAFACALAAGASFADAAQLASLASAVTVNKIGVTGTATFKEITEQLT
ncbi:MAG: sugar kinase [Clostridia bacterium]|nr:sugar kinase [Clostridia bacterium]